MIHWQKQPCTAPGCPRRIQVKKHGLCMAHYRRWQRVGDVGAGKILKRKRAPVYRAATRRRR